MSRVFACDGEFRRAEQREKDDRRKLDLKFGVFFDGTQNSIANIDERKGFENFLAERKIEKIRRTRLFLPDQICYEDDVFESRYRCYNANDSYRNEYTNVARSYMCFSRPEDESIIPIYIEGIGTKPREIGEKIDFTKAPNEEKKNQDNYASLDQFKEENDGFVSCSDDSLASALGVGLFGVKKKVEGACERIAQKVDKIIRNLKVSKDEKIEIDIRLYVFGFSRGAAAARCFSACLNRRLGKTKVQTSLNAAIIGVTQRTIVEKKLEMENTYKTSLHLDWLDDYLSEYNSNHSANIRFGFVNVKFLGLYDTVSSYGAYFTDDVEELSLEINNNTVRKVVQICAGDEYRKNFALTDITSAGEIGETIIIPGSHSDIGGGYAVSKIEEQEQIIFTSGRRGANLYRLWKELLVKDGWFNAGETERTISNLYSLIPFLLMKERIPDFEELFAQKEVEGYQFPYTEENPKEDRELEFEGIKYKQTKDLYEFYKALKENKYESYYWWDGKTIRNLSKEESDVMIKIEKIQDMIVGVSVRGYSSDIIFLYEEMKRKEMEKLEEIRRKKSNYNEALLKKIRHDYLHLSAKSEKITDLFVNGADKNEDRTVIKG